MKTRHIAAVCAVAVIPAGAAAGVAAASTSHASGFSVKQPSVTCGVMIGAKGSTPMILCSAKPVPAPPHTSSTDGDPGFVSIGASGKPTLLRLSQDSFAESKFAPLGAGATWNKDGVTCTIASSSVKCTNGSHGFTITSSHYSAF